MISSEEVIRLQGILIERFGGTAGLRNRELLESALSRPWQTFDGKELYPNPEDKSAALVESIIINPNSALGVRNLPFGLTKKLKNNFLSGLILTLNMNDLLANN